MLVASLDTKLSWYAARAGGLVAWVLITTTIVWGLALSTRVIRRKGIPAWLLDLHRYLGTLSLVFVGVHLLAIWADNYVYFGPREMLVPMASDWRPGAVAWGVVATYLLVAIQVTSWAMRRMPRRLWHAVHMSSFPLFVMATVHGFMAGADSHNHAVQWAALFGCMLVAFLVLYQLLAPRKRSTARPLPERTTVERRVDAVA
jgi:hypothetical protein